MAEYYCTYLVDNDFEFPVVFVRRWKSMYYGLSRTDNGKQEYVISARLMFMVSRRNCMKRPYHIFAITKEVFGVYVFKELKDHVDLFDALWEARDFITYDNTTSSKQEEISRQFSIRQEIRQDYSLTGVMVLMRVNLEENRVSWKYESLPFGQKYVVVHGMLRDFIGPTPTAVDIMHRLMSNE